MGAQFPDTLHHLVTDEIKTYTVSHLILRVHFAESSLFSRRINRLLERRSNREWVLSPFLPRQFPRLDVHAAATARAGKGPAGLVSDLLRIAVGDLRTFMIDVA